MIGVSPSRRRRCCPLWHTEDKGQSHQYNARHPEKNKVKAIFTELGTPPAVAKAIGNETGVKVFELNTHALPADGSYFTFMKNLADNITGALK